MRWCLIALFVTGCGSSAPGPAPSPLPTPTPTPVTLTVTATLTNTVTTAPIATQAQTVTSLPARLMFSAPGFLTRETTVNSAAPTVDLIPDAAPFDVSFYRELARDAIEGGNMPLSVLAVAPAIYLQTGSLSAADIATLEQAARAVIPAMTGGRMELAAWTTGSALPPDRVGVITVELVNDTAQPCGLTTVGASAGHSWLNVAARCGFNGHAIDPPLFAHEIGHALGFWHVSATGHLMHSRATFAERQSVLPSETERYHAAIAYHRTAGNRDLDVDPTGTTLSVRRVIE